MSKKELLFLSPYILFYLIVAFFVSENAFFWDTIQLGSSQAHWFYDNNFSKFFLPEEIDSGHPPLFGIYLATIWKIFGRSLPVSHFAMFPFLAGIVIQTYLFLKRFFKAEYTYLALLLFLVDPTLFAQSILVSPDIILILFFMLSLNAILYDNKIYLTVALIFLGLISMRGMMHILILFSIHAYIECILNKKYSLKSILTFALPYLPAILLVLTFLISHYWEKGWIGYHENSPWKESFAMVSFSGFLRNIVILGWRLTDFGRIIIWLIAFPVLWASFRTKTIDSNSKILLAIFLISLIILTPNMLIHKNLLGHRYLLIIILSFAVLVFYQISLLKPRIFKAASIFVIIILLSGNLLTYPEKISQGWDASLAHYPYYSLRSQMIDYMNEHDIPFDKTGTGFPNRTNFRHTDLTGFSGSFAEKDFEKNEYILYSNVFNEFSDAEIDELKKWKIIKKIESVTVTIILYSKE